MTGSAHDRITDKLEKCWYELQAKSDGDIPEESLLDLDDLSDIWDHCFYLQVEPHRPYHYQYGYLGSALVDAFGTDFTKSVGDDIYHIVKASQEEAQKKFQEVVNNKAPVLDEGEFCNTNHLTIKYRQLLLPLTTNGKDVTYILGGMRWTVK